MVEKKEFKMLSDSITEMKQLKLMDQHQKDLRSDLSSVNQVFENFVSSTKEKLRGSFIIWFSAIEEANEELSNSVKSKVNVEIFEKALLEKANKQSVAKALHRKANKAEVEHQLLKTQKLENLDKIADLLTTKASIEDLAKISEK